MSSDSNPSKDGVDVEEVEEDDNKHVDSTKDASRDTEADMDIGALDLN